MCNEYIFQIYFNDLPDIQGHEQHASRPGGIGNQAVVQDKGPQSLFCGSHARH